MVDMDIKRLATTFVCRILVPALTYTLLEKLTAHVVVALGGAVAVVTLAFWIPSVTTGLQSLDRLIERLRGRRRDRYVDKMCTFLNDYLRILTKYPPTLMPERLSHCMDAHLDVFAHTFESLQHYRTQGYATRYDMVRALRFRYDHFAGWPLAACEAWWGGRFCQSCFRYPATPCNEPCNSDAIVPPPICGSTISKRQSNALIVPLSKGCPTIPCSNVSELVTHFVNASSPFSNWIPCPDKRNCRRRYNNIQSLNPMMMYKT